VVFNLIVEERIMPAIWFGTVVLWSVVEQEKQKGDQKKTDVADKVRLKHEDTRNINVYVHDDIGSDEAKPRIVAEYIKQNKGDKTLWEAYGKGLLQVYDIDKTIVTPPHVPSDDE
jgi:hypothetical protein